MAFNEDVLEIVRLIPSGHFTTYGELAKAAGSSTRVQQVGPLVRKHAAPDSHRIVRKGDWRYEKRFEVSRDFVVAEGGFSHAITRLKDEGIDVSEAGVITATKGYLDAAALTLLRVAAESASSP